MPTQTMTCLSDLTVSAFASATTASEGKSFPLRQVLEFIRDDSYRDRVEYIREREKTDASRDEAKRQLPVITFAGVFDYRRNDAITQYSRLVVIDLDDLEDAPATRDLLQSDPHIACCFLSPGGNGCKPVFITDSAGPHEHGQAWQTCCDHLKRVHGITASAGQGDVARACFASWDPAAWLHEDAVPLAVDRSLVVEPPKAAPGAQRIATNRHPYLISYCARLAHSGLAAAEIEAAARTLIATRFDLSDGRVFKDREIIDAVQGALWKFAGDDQAAAVVHGDRVAQALLGQQPAPAPAPAPEPAQAPDTEKPRIVLRTRADRLKDLQTPRKWIIAGILPDGGLGALVALPGHGKSLVALELARCVSSGQPFAGHTVIGGRVIYLCCDAQYSTEQRMEASGEVGEGILSVGEVPRFPDGLCHLEVALDATPDCRLVVMDTWDSVREHTGGGYAEIDSQIETALTQMRILAKARKLAIVVVHHATRDKDQTRARGSVGFDAKMDFIGIVEQDGKTIELNAAKNRDGERGRMGRWTIEAQTLTTCPGDQVVPVLVQAGKHSGDDPDIDGLITAQGSVRDRLLTILGRVAEGASLSKRALVQALKLKNQRKLDEVLTEVRCEGLVALDACALTPAGREAALELEDRF